MAVNDLIRVATEDPSAGPETMEVIGRAALYDSAWTYVSGGSFLNSWQNFSGGWGVARYRKSSSGIVVIEGLVMNSAGTHGDTVFTLPGGYRPTAAIMFATVYVPTSGPLSFGRLNVYSGGAVILSGLTSQIDYASITCSFMADIL